MDTIPVQDTAQQIPAQPAATFTSSPVQKPLQKTNFRKFFNISSWIILFALLPVTVLIFLSQDSIPGDLFYPVKRSLENVILAAASVHPATRAAFRTDLTEIRFKEAQSLVISKSNASGLTTFIDEVQGTQLEVTSLKSDTERKKAEEKLISKIEEYQSGLSTLEAKTEHAIITSIPATSVPNLPSATPTFAPTPTFVPTPTPTSTVVFPSSKQQFLPTSTPIPTPITAPAVTANIQPLAQESIQVLEQKKIAQTIKETKISLDKIKKDLEENKRENKENREKSEERGKRDKEDREKKDNSDQDK